jgi:two-component system, chemotaxis family, CheB/CheR fusion protein
MVRKKAKEPERTPKTEAAAAEELLPVGHPSSPFPIVGIGASAGGLGAFEAFFSGMPAEVEPGMAFVLVQHLAPDHKSILTELIQRYTRMQVFEVEDGVVVQPNCAYIIPPGRDMAFLNGALQLMEPSAPRGQRLPIDFFFRSLAQDQREQAIGIVLSGTGSDGTLGVRAIKGEGGMVMAQSPESTEFDGMPRSALATGLVDFELPPAEMAAQLMAYAAHAYGHPNSRAALLQTPKAENELKKVFILLRSQTGHDFSQYKPSNLQRRIERRMSVHLIDSMESYVKFLQRTPAEVEALFRDLLIGVTNFFRDTEAFQALEEQGIPKLFHDKAAGSVIRVWCPGCSTGEEAYSIAILLQERIEAIKQGYTLQVFATDIDSRAVATARAGLYPASIAVDLSRERLARFFVAEPDGVTYRIHKGIRDTVVFSEHNVIKDPPFSKLDLISCRNLMIYLGGDLQKKLIPLFHYALNPGGVLFLGTSETVGEHANLFVSVDRKAKLFQRMEDFRSGHRAALGRFLPPMTAIHATLPQAAVKTGFPAKLPLRELTERALLREVTLAGVLVNGQGDILYMHGRAGMYLELPTGEVGLPNILKMAREGLQRELAVAFHAAVATKEPVTCPGLRVKTNGHFTDVNLSVRPLAPRQASQVSQALEAALYLVVLEEAPPPVVAVPEPLSEPADPAVALDARILALKQDLKNKDDYLQTTKEELETFNEDLKSSNEEMQSVNEELQSTNEELETSKEELQSVNEELSTVNGELQIKVADLSRANNDMNNLLAGTGIGTIFVDLDMRILRFTPKITAIINLIPSDVGRPVGHLVPNLVGYDRLVADVQEVLDTLVPKEMEALNQEGLWFTIRILPYRTLNNTIEGAVLTFVDITERKQTEEALRKANELLRLAVVVRDSHDAITVQDLEGRTLAWNPGAERLYGWSEAEALAMNVHNRIPQELRKGALATLAQLSRAEVLEPYLTQRLAKDGSSLSVSIISTALMGEDGQLYAIATTERELTARPD